MKGAINGKATWQAWLLEWKSPPPITREHDTPNGGKHLLFPWEPGIRSIPLHKLGPGVEIKGDGGYICVPPSRRADGKAYTGNGAAVASALQPLRDRMFAYYRGQRADSPGDSAGADTNEKLDPELEKLLEQDWGKGITPEPPPSEEEIRAALDVMPAEDYEEWYKIGAAIFNTLGDVPGYKVFEDWSRTSKKFKSKDCARKWKQVQDVRGINVGSIFYYADEKDPTWRERYEQRRLAAAGTAGGGESSNTGSTGSATTGKPKTLADVLKNAATLRTQTFEPLHWIVQKYLLEGLFLLGGKPKIGKSWWALDVAVAVASDNGTCMGKECEHGAVLALMLEDSDRRLQRRLTKMLGAQKEEWPKRLTYATSWHRLDDGGIACCKNGLAQ